VKGKNVNVIRRIENVSELRFWAQMLKEGG